MQVASLAKQTPGRELASDESVCLKFLIFDYFWQNVLNVLWWGDRSDSSGRDERRKVPRALTNRDWALAARKWQPDQSA